ncbi:hypothetical protein BaRGS_00001888 [Batillaria attramentaria]|uniref:G-protein coupled receptors family 1 profile domain-containing protein n=1 Tax=Batillaria attramentaria TaxID=370345 RepID=A0ABD0M6A5_9CAEN|nr:hypothetical protein BaRGS_006888 [Batillaria attramentaria]
MSDGGTPQADPDMSADDDQGDDIVYYHHSDEYWNDHHEGGEGGPTTNATAIWTEGAGGNGTQPDVWELNRQWAVRLLPLLIVLAVLLLLAIVGNSIVCFVYRTRFRRNTASLFVVFIAVVDLVSLMIGAPMEMSMLALPLVYDSAVACKVARFVETWSVCISLLALSAVAWDRHCKLFRPASFLTLKRAKWLCVVTLILALALASPALIVFGTRKVPTGVVGVEGSTCGTDDAMLNSPVRVVYIVLLLLTFTFAFLTLTVLYTLMHVRIWRRRTAGARNERVSPARHSYPRKHRFVTEDSISSCGGLDETRKFPTSSSSGGGSGGSVGVPTTPRQGRSSPGIDPARVPLKSGVKESARIGQGSSTTVDVQSTRMTWIFFIISIVCVVSVLPFLVIRTLRATTELLDVLQSPAAMALYQLAVRSYFLHAPLKPVVYLLCNHSFRRECRHMLLKLPLGSACARGPASSSQRT